MPSRNLTFKKEHDIPCTTQIYFHCWSLLGSSLSLSHTHSGLPYGFNFNFPTSIPVTFMWDSHPTPCLRQETNLDEMGFLVVPRISLLSQSIIIIIIIIIIITTHSRYLSSCHYHQINRSVTYLYV